MILFETVQIAAKRSDLTGLRFDCACGFDRHSNDMNLVQANSHYRLANTLEGIGMR